MSHLTTPVLWLQFLLVLPLLVGAQSTRQPALDSKPFSYQVLISECEEDPKCGGVLVASGYFITSATCVLGFGGIQNFLENAAVYGGGTSLLYNLGDVKDAAIHPKYTLNPTNYDVAIVKYIPDEKGPEVNSTFLNGTWDNKESCVFSSWWSDPEARLPVHLTWQSVTLEECSPYDPNLICFADNTTEFFKNDYGSPIVCGKVLTGIIPQNGGKKALNLTADYDWINSTIAELAAIPTENEDETSKGTQQYFIKILQKLEVLSSDKEMSASEQLTHWNNQVVIPLSYVLFALVIFFFVLLFFLVLFTVVLVYYSRK